MVPKYPKWTLTTIVFRKLEHTLGKNWPVGPENLFRPKKTPQNGLFWWAQIWVTELWKAMDAKRLTPGQLEAYPWKLWGRTIQTNYVGGRWHQNWAYTSPQHFFRRDTKIDEKVFLFGKTIRTRTMTTLKFGDLWFGTGSISWNLVFIINRYLLKMFTWKKNIAFFISVQDSWIGDLFTCHSVFDLLISASSEHCRAVVDECVLSDKRHGLTNKT